MSSSKIPPLKPAQKFPIFPTNALKRRLIRDCTGVSHRETKTWHKGKHGYNPTPKASTDLSITKRTCPYVCLATRESEENLLSYIEEKGDTFDIRQHIEKIEKKGKKVENGGIGPRESGAYEECKGDSWDFWGRGDTGTGQGGPGRLYWQALVHGKKRRGVELLSRPYQFCDTIEEEDDSLSELELVHSRASNQACRFSVGSDLAFLKGKFPCFSFVSKRRMSAFEPNNPLYTSHYHKKFNRLTPLKPLNPSTPQRLNTSTAQHLNTSTTQHLKKYKPANLQPIKISNPSTPQLLETTYPLTPQSLKISYPLTPQSHNLSNPSTPQPLKLSKLLSPYVLKQGKNHIPFPVKSKANSKALYSPLPRKGSIPQI